MISLGRLSMGGFLLCRALLLCGSLLAGATTILADSFQLNWEEWNRHRVADIEASRLSLQNARQELLNAGIYANLMLKQAYLRAYQNYVSVYSRYLTSLSERYRQQDQTRRALMWSVAQVRRFQAQSNICTSMTRRMWQRTLAEAVEDNFESQIYVGSIGKTLRSMAAKDGGEECVHKVLLETESSRRPIFGMSSELLGLRFINRSVDQERPAALICPADNPDLMFNPETDSPVDAYPLRATLADNSHNYYYMPFTYYQLYLLLADQAALFDLASAPANSSLLCDLSNEKNRKFYEYSHVAETALAPGFVETPAGQVVDGLFVRQLQSAHGNRAYVALINRTKTIFEKIHACTEAIRPATPAPEPTTPDQGFDPSIPSMSTALKQCFMVAETHRQMAFENEEVVAQVIRTLAEAQVDPPREPTRPDTGTVQ